MVHPPKTFSLKVLLCTIIVLFCTIKSSAQIDNVVVTVPAKGYFCSGESIPITFDITNKGNVAAYFTENTEYTIDIGTATGNGNTFVTTEIIATGLKDNPARYPLAKNNTLTVSFDVVMPTTVLANTAYVINITSINPTDENKNFSNIFEVVDKPVTAASNSGPYCIGATINLMANLTPIADPNSSIAYSWSGPNGFTSSLANPAIANADISMSGDYVLTTTNTVTPSGNSCSNISTTSIVVSNDIIWTGAISTDWNDASNWSCNYLPNAISNVIIPAGLHPVLNSGSIGICNDISIATSATLTINNSTLQVGGLITSTNAINLQGGTINFSGASAQSIPVNSFLNNQVENLTINNTAGVTNLGPLNITGTLLVNTGTLNSGDAITLISSEFQTGLISGLGNGTIVGNVTMQRYLNPAFGYKLFSSPFQGATVGNFESVVDLTADFPTFYSYDESREITPGVGATGYIPYVDTAGVLGVFKGYAVNFGNASTAKLVEVTGTVNNGTQSIVVSNSNGTYTQGFNLIGNPYPSPIDWNSPTGWTKPGNIDDALYFFTTSGTDQYTGVYTSSVNGAGGSSVIPSMQGFFVHVTGNGSATLTATNDVRVEDFSNQFVKSPETPKEIITLSAKLDDSNLKDDLLFYFDHLATIDFDARLDALKLMNTDPRVPNLYCLTNNKKPISINGIPNIIGNTASVIPLGISTSQNNWITIILKDLPNNLASNYIYLIDLKENKIIDLNQKSSYRFYSSAGKDESRFELHLSNTPLTKGDIIFDEFFSLNSSSGTIKVKMNLKNGEVGDIKVASLTGQILDTHFVANKDEVEITGIKSTGLYIISFYTTNGIFSKKVIIKN